jgi:adenylosuccinate lyase
LIGRYTTSISHIFDEQQKLEYQLLVEKEISYANFRLGKIPEAEWNDINLKCNSQFVKLNRVNEIERETSHDLMAVVLAITEQCKIGGKFIHLGATSMDVQDTVLGLQLSSAKDKLIDSVKRILDELARLTSTHRNVICIGRTHGQHAIPMTQGFKFANFLSEFLYSFEQLLSSKVNYGKISGAIGTYASYQTSEIENIVLQNLGLEKTLITNQIIPRVVFMPFLTSLISISSSAERLAKEIRNLQRPEIGEWFEGFSGTQVGSSTMPHKRNPHKSERICGLARIIRNLYTAQVENIAVEHERDLTNSAPERITFSEMIILTDFILVELQKILTNLQLDYKKIEQNLYLSNGRQMSEAIMIHLANKIGRQDAHEILNRISTENEFKKALFENQLLSKHLTRDEIEKLLEPKNYLGLVQEKIDQVLFAYKTTVSA